MQISLTILLFLCAFITSSCYAQTDDNLVSVLKKNKVEETYVFDSSGKKDGLYKIYITYLGNINTLNKQLKIIIQKMVWGPNEHTSGTVYIYNNKNQFMGKYALGSGYDLPYSIQKSQLIVTNKYKKECDPKLVTAIDFSSGIPQKIFIKCKGDLGDIYSFSTQKD